MNIKLENICKPATIKEMQSFEQEWNIKLPDEYKEFLLKNNGGNPIVRRFKTLDGKHTSSLTLLFPFSEEVHKNVKNVFLAFNTNNIIASNFLIIGEDPIDNKICLSLSKEDAGAVYYWSLDIEDIYEEGYQPSYTHFSIIANSFKEFINSLKES